ncbi:MAG: C4-type zinc ribbon domain-containing protein [Desulfotignum sp.]|nr:C4-type zinc ribbon domain-containing protein [Desulfotignum sp.]
MNETLKKEIETLVRLQRIELEMIRLQQEVDKVENEKKGLAARLSAFETALEADRLALAQIQQQCTDLEQEIQVVNDRIIKSNETLRMVKTNKEYQVLLREVDDNKKRKNGLEDHVLTLYEQREAAEIRLKETEAQYLELKQQILAEQAKIDELTMDDREQLAELEEQQRSIGASLNPALLTRFRRIARMNQGQAVARISDETCMGCFMNVPPQLCIEVQRGNQMISCPQCSRILYHIDEG